MKLTELNGATELEVDRDNNAKVFNVTDLTVLRIGFYRYNGIREMEVGLHCVNSGTELNFIALTALWSLDFIVLAALWS